MCLSQIALQPGVRIHDHCKQWLPAMNDIVTYTNPDNKATITGRIKGWEAGCVVMGNTDGKIWELVAPLDHVSKANTNEICDFLDDENAYFHYSTIEAMEALREVVA